MPNLALVQTPRTQRLYSGHSKLLTEIPGPSCIGPFPYRTDWKRFAYGANAMFGCPLFQCPLQKRIDARQALSALSRECP